MSKTPDEVRAARLRALVGGQGGGDGNDASSSDHASTMDVAPAHEPPPPSASVAASSIGGGGSVRWPTEGEMAEMRGLLWPSTATEDDLARWHQQGFVFQDTPSFGLTQGQGGPCGVLAAVQSELLRLLIFGEAEEPPPPASSSSSPAQLPTPTPEQLTAALAGAMAAILERARPTGKELETTEAEEGERAARAGGSSSGSSSSPGDGLIHVACPSGPTALPLPATNPIPATALAIHTFPTAGAAAAFIASNDGSGGFLSAYHSPSGVMLFALSLLMTRGVPRIRGDMDDEGNTLTGRFGHCTQELLNLLLVGRAVSNVFDGERELGDSGLTLRGISARPTTGYLTHLETLRYVQVGSLMKTPRFPIWVLGSSSHFSVLFSMDKGCNEASEAEQLLAKAQRVFSQFDPEEGGFIQGGDLRQVLIELDLLAVALDERAHDRLKVRLEMPGSGGLILWQDFWQAVSQLLTGVSLDTYLLRKEEEPTVAAAAPIHPSPAASPMAVDAAEGDGRERSDSDIARALQAQFDAGGNGDDDEAATQALIRQLQEQEGQGQSMLSALPSSSGGEGPSSTSSSSAAVPSSSSQPPQAAAVPSGAAPATTAESAPGTYTLYHFNGLAGPGGRAARLVRFSLTKKTPDDGGAVVGGRTIAFGTSPIGSGAAFSCPVEEVLATKWPGAKFNWHGEPPPSID